MSKEGKILLRIPYLAFFLVNLFGRLANDLNRLTEKNEIPQEVYGIFTEYAEDSVKAPQIM